MPQRSGWTPEHDDRLRELHAAGTSMHGIAQEMGWSKPTISKKAKALGLDWDRTQTAKATEALVVDARGRRAKLQLALLEDAEKLRQQAWKPTVVFNFGGKDNTYEQRTIDEPTFADKLKIMQAVGIAVDRSLKLDLHDSAAGAAQVVGLLQETARALGIADDADTRP